MARWLLIIALLISVFGYSQSKLDSLKGALDQAKSDSVKIKTLHRLYFEYQKDSVLLAEKMLLDAIALSEKANEPKLQAIGYNLYGGFLRVQSREDSAITVLTKGLEIAKSNNFPEQQSDALVYLGYNFWQKGDFEKAAEYQLENLKLCRQMGDSMRVGNSYIGLGNILSQQGEYTKAMKYYTLASERAQESEDWYGYRMAISNIGYIQRSLENYDSAIAYFKKSDSISETMGDVSGRAFASYNLSVVYKNTGQLDAALAYNTKGRKLYEKLGQRKRVSYCYFTLGEIHKKKKDFAQALEAYQESLKLSRAIDDSVQIGYSSMAVADMYNELDNSEQSITHLDNAKKVAERMRLDILAMDVHERLAERLKRSGDLSGAYENLQRFIVLKDSLYTREKRELGSEIEAKYQNEQQAKEIALLASEKELQALQLSKRKNERNGIIAVAIFILLLAGLLYNQYRIKQKANKELKELNALKSNFFANISHEFRTPLTLIQGPIENLEQNPEEQLDREDVKMIRRNTNKVLGLVNQLLDLSKIDEGKLELKSSEGDVFKCLRTAAASFNSHAAQRNMDYRVTVPNEVLWAAFDRDKLEKVVYNVLSNAFKFSEDGESVAFKASYNGEELLIHISDSGRGISEEKLPFIFDRFFQVDSSSTKDREGSGIGLSLSKDLIELMDGTITVSSEEGKGTFFTIQVPIEKIRMPEIKTDLVPSAPADKNIGIKAYEFPKAEVSGAPKILVIEDNEDMRQHIRKQLLQNYSVIEAKHGEQGLKLAASNTPELVITDLMMPKMDGMEVCRRLKSDIHTSHIPIIMLTARAGEANKIEGLETGADDYLTKPFSAKELMARVKNLIAQRKRLLEYYQQNERTLVPEKITTTSLDKKFLEQVLTLLEKNHTDSNFGVTQMQRELAMSKTQLNRKLKALTRESPRDLLRNFRLKRAAQLLAQKSDTVTQIAYQVGFTNLSYFAKCFKELYGVSPSSY